MRRIVVRVSSVRLPSVPPASGTHPRVKAVEAIPRDRLAAIRRKPVCHRHVDAHGVGHLLRREGQCARRLRGECRPALAVVGQPVHPFGVVAMKEWTGCPTTGQSACPPRPVASAGPSRSFRGRSCCRSHSSPARSPASAAPPWHPSPAAGPPSSGADTSVLAIAPAIEIAMLAWKGRTAANRRRVPRDVFSD